jgi:hypothetical protein
MSATTRITAFIGEELGKKFTGLTRQIGVSGTALLTRTLPVELNYLAEISSNSEKDETAWRLIGRLIEKLAAARPRRLNVTLDRRDAERMDQLCREKRVSRDLFIHQYIYFLVNGADGCEAPLVKISKILANPRYEYERARRRSPDEDYTEYAPTGEIIEHRALCKDNPYSALHIDGESLELAKGLLEQLRKDRAPETR